MHPEDHAQLIIDGMQCVIKASEEADEAGPVTGSCQGVYNMQLRDKSSQLCLVDW